MIFLLLFLLKTLITWSKILFYQSQLNKQILSQYTKKILGMKRKITGLEASHPTYLKFMSVASIHRWTSSFTTFFLNTSFDLEKGRVNSNVYLLWQKNETCEALLADLSKAFYCLPHDLIDPILLMVAIFHHLNCLTLIYATDANV